jgi:hypothetical protein
VWLARVVRDGWLEGMTSADGREGAVSGERNYGTRM